ADTDAEGLYRQLLRIVHRAFSFTRSTPYTEATRAWAYGGITRHKKQRQMSLCSTPGAHFPTPAAPSSGGYAHAGLCARRRRAVIECYLRVFTGSSHADTTQDVCPPSEVAYHTHGL